MSKSTEDVITERGVQNGRPEDFYEQLSDVRSGLLQRKFSKGKRLNRSECVAMMQAFKTVRCFNNINHTDSWVDAAGYAYIGELFSVMSEGEKIRLKKLIEDMDCWDDQRKKED